MSDILYERPLSSGPHVRVRRTTPDGESPVRVVLEVDRRGGVLREGQTPGYPPALMEAEGATESEALAQLLPVAMEDAEVARVMQMRGLR